MHDSGLASDLLARALQAAEGKRLRSLQVEVGALSGVGVDHLRETIVRQAELTLGEVPRVEVVVSDDVAADGAQGVTLRRVTV